MPSGILASLKDNAPRKNDQDIATFQFKGYLVMVGMNSYSNERLVSEHPHRGCLWMHAMAARGSHVVLCSHAKEEPSEEVIQYAAGLALKNSHSEALTVSVALLKDVYKPEGYGIGVFKPSKSASVDLEKSL
jgi:predicted ribosome quality control (RQC) complex YloA/Tae2 family protein